MNILRRIAVSLRSSPMAMNEKQVASSEQNGAGFVTSDAGRSLVGALTLARELAKELYEFCHCDHHARQIVELEILLQQLNQHPKSANNGGELPVPKPSVNAK